jgi:DNA mismatch endonuclease (patch repair protein)
MPHKGYKPTLEHIEKIRLSKLGKKRPDLIGNTWNRGRHPWNFGKKNVYIAESLDKMKKAKIGRKLSKRHKINIGLGGIGRKQSLSSRRKIAFAKLGNKNPAKREDVRKKMSEIASRPEVIASKERKMKYSGTTIEMIIRKELKRRHISFKPNFQILKKYNADIFIEPNIDIECDGEYWHNLERVKVKDKKRDRELKDDGYIVLRFWESDIKKSVTNCVDIIQKEL